MKKVTVNDQEFELVYGIGDYNQGKACILSAAVALHRFQAGEPLGEVADDVDCIGPIIRNLLVRYNDSPMWRDDNHRTEVLGPYVSRILNTNNPALTIKHASIAVDYAVRRFAPLALRHAGLENLARRLELLKPIQNHTSINAERTVFHVHEAVKSYSTLLPTFELSYDNPRRAAAHSSTHCALIAAKALRILDRSGDFTRQNTSNSFWEIGKYTISSAVSSALVDSRESVFEPLILEMLDAVIDATE